jgi:anti-sigma factor RsiW
MPTEDQIQLVHAYLDGELDAADALAIKAQIDADPRLAAELARASALRQTLGASFPRDAVPESLRRRIAAIEGVRRWPRPTWTLLAASILLTVALSGGSTWFALRAPGGDHIAPEILGGHVRSLIASKPTDIAASERHVVKPWFNGRIPQAPRVIDLASDGFPLLGARIDVIARTPVPTLVYKRRLHVISLVALPVSAGQTAADSMRSDAGYNTAQWSDATTSYFATSDLNAEELRTFVKLFRAAPG